MREKNLIFTEQYLKEDRIKSIKINSIILIVLSFIQIILTISKAFNFTDSNLGNLNYIIIITSTLLMLSSCFVWLIPEHTKTATIIMFISIFVMIIVYDFLFSYYASLVLAVPLILSTRHYNKKTTLFMSIMITIALLISSFCVYGYVLAFKDTALLAKFRDPTINFNKLSDIMGEYFIKILMYCVLFISCYFISSNGYNMLKDQASMTAETTSLESDMKNASQIQNQVLPTDFSFAVNNGVDIYASMTPAKEVAGDFYDFFKVGKKIYFLVGDVSDKGLYAAMFMMNVKNIIQAIANNLTNLDEIITQANKLICKNNKALMFVTLWIGQIDIETNKSYYINAGHCNAFIKDKNEDVRQISSKPQPFIGTFPNFSFRVDELDLNKNETIFLYTDGITDAENELNESFGEERLVEVLKNSSLSPKELCENVSKSVKQFSLNKEQFDDITILGLCVSDFDYNKHFDSNHDNIPTIIDSISLSLKESGASDDVIYLVGAAIDDLLDNIISYAYKKDNDQGFLFQYKILNNTLKMVVTDKGIAFDPLKVKEADLSPNREIGGLGIHLIKNIMDDISYTRNDDENVLVLTKNF